MCIRDFQWKCGILGFFVTCLLMSSQGIASSAPSHQSYRLGPNDVVRIQVYGEEDLTVDGKVDGDGNINYPLLGMISVAGKTSQELQEYLTTRLAGGYVRDPKVTASIFKYRNFYVSGEVRTPGGFPYEEGLSVQKAISIAGGMTDKAEKHDVSILRLVNGKEQSFPVKVDSVVLPDDTIVVAEGKRFYVNGEVKSPGRYLYEKGMTVHKAITMVGGFTDKAAVGRTKILRIVNGEEQSIRVNLDAIVLPEDIVVVPRSFF